MQALGAAIKNRLREVPWLFYSLKKLYRVIFPAPAPLDNELQACIERVLSRNKTIYFVQVGSNDGKQGDPLYPLIKNDRRWRGIFIEPVGFLFARLLANYGKSERFVFEKVAIAREAGSARFYYLAEQAKMACKSDLPYWFDQLGSFNKQHILDNLDDIHLDKGLEAFIVEEEIDCVPLPELLQRNKVARIDLLHIDTEGYDYQVLAQVDFTKYRPVVVIYEHIHLAATEQNRARQLLADNGYNLHVIGRDTLALLQPARNKYEPRLQ